MKRLQIPQKLLHKKFYVHKKSLRTQNCRGGFIKKTQRKLLRKVNQTTTI